MTKADIVVIGGGAAGMMAAGTASEAGMNVLLAEPNARRGRKLRITGKGRCNVTNNCSVREFMTHVPRNPKFLYSALTAFPPEDAMSFFESLGVPLKTERGNRVFPCSDNANDIADALDEWVNRSGVRALRNRVDSIEIDEAGSVCGVRTDKGVIPCRAAILCTGGVSYPATGSTGDGFQMAKMLGHTVFSPQASLVPLNSPDGFCADMAGFSPRNVTLTVLENGKVIFQEMGEMLFTHFGVSGPLVLSASAHILHWEEKEYKLLIDFKPALDEETLDERVLRDFDKFRNRDFSNALSELLPKSMIPVVVELSGISGKVHSVTRQQRQTLVKLLKQFPVNISGTRPVSDAIVTRGGVNVREVNPRTMESKIVSGLYFAGEILDVDAYTGGYNLQIAWATGRCAGAAAGKELSYE